MNSRNMKYLAAEEKVEDKKEERNLDYNFDNLDISVNILLVLKPSHLGSTSGVHRVLPGGLRQEHPKKLTHSLRFLHQFD